MYLTVIANRRFIRLHRLITRDLPTIPALMFELASDPSSFGRLLGVEEVMKLPIEEITKLARERHPTWTDEDVTTFADRVEGMDPGDTDPERFMPDLWKQRSAKEITDLQKKAGVCNVLACQNGLNFSAALDLSKAMLTEKARHFMLFWEVVDFLGPERLGAPSSPESGPQSPGSPFAMSPTGRVFEGVDIEMGSPAASEPGSPSRPITRGAGASPMRSGKPGNICKVLHKQMALLTDARSYKADRVGRLLSCSASGNHISMQQVWDIVNGSSGNPNPKPQAEPKTVLQQVRGLVGGGTTPVEREISDTNLAALCVLPPSHVADITVLLTRAAQAEFTENQAFVIHHKFELPWVMYNIITTRANYTSNSSSSEVLGMLSVRGISSADDIISGRCGADCIGQVKELMAPEAGGELSLYWSVFKSLYPSAVESREMIDTDNIAVVLGEA